MQAQRAAAVYCVKKQDSRFAHFQKIVQPAHNDKGGILSQDPMCQSDLELMGQQEPH